MKITSTDVAYVAALANLDVPGDEMETLAGELSRIVEYIGKLNELDTGGVEPTTRIARGRPRASREDKVAERDGSAVAGREGRLFRVPRVIGER
jgi:aspartyl-tRNA(Asn)/glutamyl-tRNA(Gln) amidotransferase subunit C